MVRPRYAGALVAVENDEMFQPMNEPAFAIGVKKDEEAPDSPAEICGRAQRNQQSAYGEGASVRGGGHNQARLSLFPAVEDDPCPSGAGFADSSIGPGKRRQHVYSRIRASPDTVAPKRERHRPANGSLVLAALHTTSKPPSRSPGTSQLLLPLRCI